MRSAYADTTIPDPTIQYGTASAATLYDDDASRRPTVDPACSLRAGGGPGQPADVRNVIQVHPNPNDQPEPRKLQLWAAIRGASTASAASASPVSWSISTPNGDPLGPAIEGTRLAASGCSQLGGSSAPRSMFAAAIGTGQLSETAVNDPTAGLKGACERGEIALYAASFTISNQRPCGEYRVQTRITVPGAAAPLTSFFDVICFYFAQYDFDRIDWGTITSGTTSTIVGDLTFANSPVTAPTVRNVGNDGMTLSVNFQPMVKANAVVAPISGTAIAGTPVVGASGLDQFGACFGRQTSSLKCVNTGTSSRQVDFGNGRDQVLCANEVGRLDLSVTTAPGVPVGSYTGSLQLSARPIPAMC